MTAARRTKSWYSIRNRAGDGAATEIALLGPIGAGGVTAEAFLAQLKEISGPIALTVSSIGGEFFPRRDDRRCDPPPRRRHRARPPRRQHRFGDRRIR